MAAVEPLACEEARYLVGLCALNFLGPRENAIRWDTRNARRFEHLAHRGLVSDD